MLSSVRSKFACITALGVAAVACVGLFALSEKSNLAATLGVVLVDSQAMGNHKEADMMHDALRSDVLASFVASTPEEFAAAEADLKEAQVNYYSALYDALISKVELDKATGNLK